MRSPAAVLALAVLLAGCGTASEQPASGTEEREGVVSSSDGNVRFTVETEDGSFTYELREASTIIDDSGARRGIDALAPGTHVSIRARVSDSGRRTAERVTVLHLANPSLPSVIVPPEQD